MLHERLEAMTISEKNEKGESESEYLNVCQCKVNTYSSIKEKRFISSTENTVNRIAVCFDETKADHREESDGQARGTDNHFSCSVEALIQTEEEKTPDNTQVEKEVSFDASVG